MKIAFTIILYISQGLLILFLSFRREIHFYWISRNFILLWVVTGAVNFSCHNFSGKHDTSGLSSHSPRYPCSNSQLADVATDNYTTNMPFLLVTDVFILLLLDGHLGFFFWSIKEIQLILHNAINRYPTWNFLWGSCG